MLNIKVWKKKRKKKKKTSFNVTYVNDKDKNIPYKS